MRRLDENLGVQTRIVLEWKVKTCFMDLHKIGGIFHGDSTELLNQFATNFGDIIVLEDSHGILEVPWRRDGCEKIPVLYGKKQ